MNLGACARLNFTPENRTWYRAIQPGYSPTALSSAHTKGSRSRFSAGPLLLSTAQFEILYFAEDHQTAIFEFCAMIGSAAPGRGVPHPGIGVLVLNAQIVLQQVYDLSSVSEQSTIQTNVQELTGDWDGYQSRSVFTSVSAPVGIAETQTLGESLFSTGVEGFRSVSAKIPYTRTLMVFPTNMRRGSSVQYIEIGRGVVHRIDGTL